MNDPLKPPSALGRFFGWLRRPSGMSLVSLLVIGAVAGIIFWAGFNEVLHATSTDAFCISCHELKDQPYVEYQETPHYKNRSGVRAGCADCHVPRDFVPKLIRKVEATKEVWGHFTGIISTPEKFEAMRMKMAQVEWESMKASNSRECRECHAWDAMAKAKQRPKAQRNHEKAQKEGNTCIDCHKGVAHLLPKEYEPPEEGTKDSPIIE